MRLLLQRAQRAFTLIELLVVIATTFDEALSMAASQNKPILLVAYQGDPNAVDQMLLSEPSVTERSDRFVVAKLDAKTQSEPSPACGSRDIPPSAC
jgi:hypothetical protein